MTGILSRSAPTSRVAASTWHQRQALHHPGWRRLGDAREPTVGQEHDRGPATSEQQLEAELDEAREVRLVHRVLVDGAELVAVLVGDVLPLVVHGRVEHVEGLDAEL